MKPGAESSRLVSFIGDGFVRLFTRPNVQQTPWISQDTAHHVAEGHPLKKVLYGEPPGVAKRVAQCYVSPKKDLHRDDPGPFFVALTITKFVWKC